MILTQAKFGYNNNMDRSIGKTYFEIVTRMQPRGISDLGDIADEEKKVLKEKYLLKL